MADFIFKISPNIVLGSYTANRLGQYVLEYGRNFMVVLDPVLKESGTSDKVLDSLKEKKVEYFVFDEITNSADTETLVRALKLAQNAKVHGIIAVGGGKTLSLAKAICAVYYEDYDVYDFIDDQIVPGKKMLPLICVPTTNRDSFLFTDRTLVTDSRSSKAKLIKTQNGLCRLVVWDPNLQIALTEKQVEVMAIEALAFAVEGYLSQKATFFSDMIIEKAVQLLSYALDGAPTLSITTPQEVLLAQGGCMASLGAASSSYGATNLLSVAINSRYKVSRSLTSSILLPYIIEDAATFRADKLAAIAKLLRACDQDATPAEASAALAEYVRQKIAKVDIPARLKDLSLSIEQLALAAEDAGELDLINNLQRSMTTDDLFEIIKKAY
ncbi:MAG: iron-containing alcohol dehydrogenase [Treponema sp.]|nr:iron-containing alcohol dehydrogenase [Spirochaetia bacterium]MDD7459539.1 iron-containing alcohol dehydrogenase [Spirochaetales bacterium]MDY5810845.1 iron-containing alcohol dehydrogenase [Treponema sp.]MEE1181274.1 iron-containing alcohol dehydrogenase [Treponema sp.]